MSMLRVDCGITWQTGSSSSCMHHHHHIIIFTSVSSHVVSLFIPLQKLRSSSTDDARECSQFREIAAIQEILQPLADTENLIAYAKNTKRC